MNQIDPSTGLKDSHRKQIIDILLTNVRVEQAWLFGSRAIGTFRENSDIDLVIQGRNITLTDLASLVDLLDRTSIPFKIDLLVKENITTPALLEHIDRYGIRWI